MNTDPTESQPELAAPGAGLPFPELLAARVIFNTSRLITSSEAASQAISRERREIGRLVDMCPQGLAAKQVLIPRLRGMEDSSRFWSVLMTLDHLRIVNRAIAITIRQLGKGVEPSRKASTADVKPSPSVGPDVVEAFGASCDEVEASFADLCVPHPTVRSAHPWFGPLDAKAWHFLCGFHMRLHRKQIEAILNRMGD